MADILKVRRFGGSLGILLPKSVADTLALHEGDALRVTATPEGLQATPCDPDFERAMGDARAFMRTHRNAFRELAK